MGATLSDIAARSGVSTSVVSSVMRGGGDGAIGYSPATKQRVIRAAKELDYKPKATNGIGLIYSTGETIPGESDWVSDIGPILTSLNLEAMTSNKLLSLHSYSSEQLDQEVISGKLPRILSRQKVDGLILAGQLGPALIEHLTDGLTPYVLMNVTDADSHEEDAVCFDEINAGLQGVRYLQGIGHERILYVDHDYHADKYVHYSMTGRLQGYRMGMEEAGREPQILHLHTSTFYVDDPVTGQFQKELRQLLTGPEKPTAILAYNEPMALRCLRVMTKQKIGFDDVALLSIAWQYRSQLSLLGISVMELPAMRMGKIAYEMLLEKIDTGKGHPTVSLRGKVVEAASTGR